MKTLGESCLSCEYVLQVRGLCEKAKEILMQENNVQVFIIYKSFTAM